MAEGSAGVSIVKAIVELGDVLVGSLARFVSVLCRSFRRQL